MSLEQIIEISVIAAAFVVFAAILAWGEFQTRHITGRVRDHQGHVSRAVPFNGAAASSKKASLGRSRDDDDTVSRV